MLLRRWLAPFLLLLFAVSPATLADIKGKPCSPPQIPKSGGFAVKPDVYHGWSGSLTMGNGLVEVTIVPAIGRVMQFCLKGEKECPFFENRALDGKPPDPNASEWVNFGGDKTWPAPQDDWPKLTPRKWPPPPTFDSVPLKYELKNPTFSKSSMVPFGATAEAIELISPVDPHYGIQTRRIITLEPGHPVMSIRTIYEKVQGDPVKVGVWVITQLSEPKKAGMILPATSQYPQGYNKQMEVLPKDLKREGRFVSLTRGSKNPAKIGSDAGTLVWMNKKFYVQIDSSREAGAEYPDQGSSAEIYTNPDPLKYVELETLGPLHTMKVGDTIERTNRYTLLRRKEGEKRLEELLNR